MPALKAANHDHLWGRVSAVRGPRPHLSPFLLVFLALAFTAVAARSAHADGNLLAGKRPSAAAGVSNTAALTDGIAAFEGSEWNTTVAAPFASNRAYVEFDLGSSVPIVAAYLQGDNNDEYVVLDPPRTTPRSFRLLDRGATPGVGHARPLDRIRAFGARPLGSG